MKQRCEVSAEVVMSVAIDTGEVTDSEEFELIFKEEIEAAMDRIRLRVNETAHHQSLFSDVTFEEAEFSGIISC